MSFEMTDLNRINIRKDGGEYIDFRFRADTSVGDIDLTLRNIFNIPKGARYTIVYRDEISGRDNYVVGSGIALRECLQGNVTKFDVLIIPKTPVMGKLKLKFLKGN